MNLTLIISSAKKLHNVWTITFHCAMVLSTILFYLLVVQIMYYPNGVTYMFHDT